MTDEVLTQEVCDRMVESAINDAMKIIALNTPMCDSEVFKYGYVADEMDQARCHLRTALWYLSNKGAA